LHKPHLRTMLTELDLFLIVFDWSRCAVDLIPLYLLGLWEWNIWNLKDGTSKTQQRKLSKLQRKGRIKKEKVTDTSLLGVERSSLHYHVHGLRKPDFMIWAIRNRRI